MSVFVTIVESGSFPEASARLGMPRAPISRRIVEQVDEDEEEEAMS